MRRGVVVEGGCGWRKGVGVNGGRGLGGGKRW